VLAARAAADPETPFLFFRGARGQVTWWSWKRCLAETSSVPAAEEDPSFAVPRAFLKAMLEEEVALAVPEAPPGELGAPRPIWLSAAPLDRPAERRLARLAAEEGWAVFREPGLPIHPDTFLWARPTLLAGEVAELEALLDGVLARAPRWPAGWRRIWLARRMRRLCALLVPPGRATDGLTARLRRAGAAARVLPFPGGGW
jgi:hypothetical protein